MDILEADLIQFWTILNKHKVAYIMVGGFAVNLYGYTRATNDVDLLLKDDIVNRQQLGVAFAELGYGNISFQQLEFVPGWTNFYIGTSVHLDIMTVLKSVDLSFDECLQMAPVAEIEGVMIRFLHINHLIQNKKVVNGPKDQLDVMELEKIKKILEERKA